MATIENEHPQDKKVTVYIMGKSHQVPAEATIMGAMEYAGYQLVRGAGCREGYCGACATTYRMPDDYKIYTGLACTTVVRDKMWFAQIPAIPVRKAIYNIDELAADGTSIQKLYPEVFRCVACNTCTKACPQDLEVMDYIQAAMRGDIEAVMDLSFDCLCCGMCALRCPAEITQFNIGILAKRLYGKYLRKESKELGDRVREISQGKYQKEYKQLMSMSKQQLSRKYYARDIE